jgi:hypothetical protein
MFKKYDKEIGDGEILYTPKIPNRGLSNKFLEKFYTQVADDVTKYADGYKFVISLNESEYEDIFSKARTSVCKKMKTVEAYVYDEDYQSPVFSIPFGKFGTGFVSAITTGTLVASTGPMMGPIGLLVSFATFPAGALLPEPIYENTIRPIYRKLAIEPKLKKSKNRREALEKLEIRKREIPTRAT